MSKSLWDHVSELMKRAIAGITTTKGTQRGGLGIETKIDLETLIACLRELGRNSLADMIKSKVQELDEAAQRETQLKLMVDPMGSDEIWEDFMRAGKELEASYAALAGCLRSVTLLPQDTMDSTASGQETTKDHPQSRGSQDPSYFLTVRLPFMLLGSDAIDHPDRLSDTRATHEKKAQAFYEVDSAIIGDSLLELFTYDKPKPGIPGDPNAPVGSFEGLRKLTEGVCQPVFELVNGEDLDLAQRVFYRGHIELLEVMDQCDGDPGVREDAGLPNDRGTLLLWRYYRQARQWEPLIRDELGLADHVDHGAPAMLAPAAVPVQRQPDQRGTATNKEGSANKELPPSRIKAQAVYDWALAAIEGAGKMTIFDLFTAMHDRLDSEIAKAYGRQAEKLQELKNSLPPSPETFGRYLRDAGIKKYNSRGDRVPGRSIRRRSEI